MHKMNEIETKFFRAFQSFVNSKNEKSFITTDTCLEYKYYFNREEDWINLEIEFDTPTGVSKTSVELTFEKQSGDFDFYGYIPDFTISVNGYYSGYVIEIDSYQWHEKTKEQAILDKKKDRAYLKLDFIPIRFSGLEVFHEPMKCIQDLFEIIVLQEYSRERGKIEYLEAMNFSLENELSKLKKVRGKK